MALRGGGGSKGLYNGQGKMRFGQGKVSKKSGNLISRDSKISFGNIWGISL